MELLEEKTKLLEKQQVGYLRNLAIFVLIHFLISTINLQKNELENEIDLEQVNLLI
jgi:hypothetical protein